MMVKDMYKASMIEFVFKVIKNLVPPIFQNYYIFNARRVTRQNKELLISRVKTEQAKQTVYELWNKFQNHQKLLYQWLHTCYKWILTFVTQTWG